MSRTDRSKFALLARQYALRGAVGACVGAALGFCAAFRGAAERGTPLSHVNPLPTTALVAAIGCVAGLIFWRLRGLRERGGFYYGLSWAISVGAAAGLVFLPESVETHDWRLVIVVTCLGFFGGFGLAAFTIEAFRDQG